MAARNQIHGPHARAQLLPAHGTNPLSVVGVRLELDVHHVPRGLYPAAEDLLSVAEGVRAPEDPLYDGLLVVQQARVVGDDGGR